MTFKNEKQCKAILLPILSTLILISSCKKIDAPGSDEAVVHRFFQNAAVVNPTLQRVADQLKKQQAQHPGFIASLVTDNGYAVWDKSIIKTRTNHLNSGRTGETQNDTIVLLPLVQPESYTVDAYIEAHLTGSITLNIYQDDGYKNYSYGELNSAINNAEKFALEFMLLDSKVFGYQRFRITDTILFRYGMPPVSNLPRTGKYTVLNIAHITSSQQRILITTPPDDCYEVEIWYDPDGAADPGHESGNEYFTGETYWVGDCNSGGSGGGFGTGFGGGGAIGGGGGTGGGGAIVGGGGGGWVNTGSVAQEYDPAITNTDPDIYWWEDLSTSYPAQPLPGWSNMYSNYPKDSNGGDMPGPQVYNLVGGNILAMYNSNPSAYQNACALRISRALNYSGVNIPNIPGHTFLGSDNKYYFLSSAKLYNWMKKTFGMGDIILNQSQGGTNGAAFQAQLAGNKGIYIVQVAYPAQFGALGHATLFDGVNCIGNECYFDATGGVAKITLWKLN